MGDYAISSSNTYHRHTQHASDLQRTDSGASTDRDQGLQSQPEYYYPPPPQHTPGFRRQQQQQLPNGHLQPYLAPPQSYPYPLPIQDAGFAPGSPISSLRSSARLGGPQQSMPIRHHSNVLAQRPQLTEHQLQEHVPKQSTKHVLLPPRPEIPASYIPSYAFGACPPHPTDAQAPRLGQTRCYWTVLSAQLTFMYLDPTLQLHMSRQGPLMAGRSILDFVHPDEVASARRDLSRVSQNKEINGSVTRVRFLRLSVIRLEFGASKEELETFPGQMDVAFDENYLTADLVINWVAEGVVLCFIHAIMDLSDNDNDAKAKTPWTNWCKTDLMDQRHCEALYRVVSTPALSHPINFDHQEYTPNSGNQIPPQPLHTSHDRVFQIVRNDDHRPTLFSWPPLSTPDVSALVGGATMGMTDLEATEFSRLAKQIPISDASAAALAERGAKAIGSRGEEGHKSVTEMSTGHAQTSCTSRFIHVEDTFEVPGSNGIGRKIDCVYIPHGSIIFACYKIMAGPPVQQLLLQQPPQAGYYGPPDVMGYKNQPSYQYNQPYPGQPYSDPHVVPQPPSWGPQQPQIYAGSEDGSSTSHPYAQQHQSRNQIHPDQNHAYPSQSLATSSITPLAAYGNEIPSEMRPQVNGGGRPHSHQQPPPQTRPAWVSGPPAWSGGPVADGVASIQPPPHNTPPSSAEVDGSFNQYPHGQYHPPLQQAYHPAPYDQQPYPSPIVTTTRPMRSQSHSAVPTSASGEVYYAPHGQYGPPYNYHQPPPLPDGTPSPFPPESSGEEGSVGNHGGHDEYMIDNQHYGGANGAHYSPPDGTTKPRYNSRGSAMMQSPPPVMGSPTHPLIPKEREPCGARVGGVPPPGVTQCISCSTINSPEWRKGASGKKDLCNACGLRFARSRQKLEGKHPQRRVRRDPVGFSPAPPGSTPIRNSKKTRGTVARRATVSSVLSGESSVTTQTGLIRDEAQLWDPYSENSSSRGADGEGYHPQQHALPSDEDHASYQRTSYDRGGRYPVVAATELPHHASGGLAPPHPSEYNYPLTPATAASEGVPKR
ncbi:hypothetical protein FRB94_004263 [Tulasnella sp. JGI-2019a]|nr:hypothetical protein FRB93_000264 [Tulasnella sp. JGI-2019a]KAG9015144.1 hypothetical protein FRB94_004263 [Tulasnella sp. JGI-2019a]KAG9039213.1 hypothetical protein FRB95_011798 [Tulasnella sp. JGI-2019a]